MSLFRVSPQGLIPFRPIDGGSVDPAEVTNALIQALWSDLDAIGGGRLMAIHRGGADGSNEVPMILALDGDGSAVVVYASAQLDSAGLAHCLEQVGLARRSTVSELASGYWRGSDEFWRDWQDFSGTSSPVSSGSHNRPLRLVIVTTAIPDSTEAALSFLTEAGTPVSVRKASMYVDAEGCQLLELAHEPASPHEVRQGASEQRKVATPHTVENAQPAPAPRNTPNPGQRTTRLTSHMPDREAEVGQRGAAGRNMDVGAMNHAVADELFSGSSGSRQSRFTRPTSRVAANPPAASVSQLRRKQPTPVEIEPPGAEDDYDQGDEDQTPRFGRNDDALSEEYGSPQLAPLRFPSELVEPPFPEELMNPGVVSANGRGHSA
ncbi:MAG TPA: hypothetical protein VHU91_01770 [Mycobacteriales bacterium]|jgi:hypothetical protein|nr:hypothetical protein [Mycobacteriales bacterium]